MDLLNVPLTAANASLGAISLFGEPRNPKTTYSQAFNLQVQYEIAPNTLAFMSAMLGSNGKHIMSSIGSNAVSSILAPTANTKTNSFFKDFAVGGNYVSRVAQPSNYNSLQTGVEHRFSHGFSVLSPTSLTPSALERCTRPAGQWHWWLPCAVCRRLRTSMQTTLLCDIDVRRIFHTSGSL